MNPCILWPVRISLLDGDRRIDVMYQESGTSVDFLCGEESFGFTFRRRQRPSITNAVWLYGVVREELAWQD
jgi:hypothetical protein